jgi:hypothetical protein
MIRIRTAPTPDKLVIGKCVLFTLLTTEALALFVARLPGTLQFDNFAFFDTGANLSVQYLINHGYRPTLDFIYAYGLLPLVFGRIWFSIWGLTPLACVAAMPLIDILIVWGFVRFATNLKLNVAGVLIILLTASLTIFPSFINLTHGIEPVFLVHALADQAGGNRRRALALATAALFVKPSMAFFLGLVLLGFIVADCLRYRARPLRAFVAEICPAIMVGTAIAILLAASFGLAPVVRSMIPREGLVMYRAEGFGFFNGAGRSFLAPPSAPWSYYLANVAGPWIAYTIILAIIALIIAPLALKGLGAAEQTDRTPELVLSCAFLHLSFIFFFFGNQLSWIYYFYIPVLGLAAAARLGIRWEVLVACLAFAVPLTKVDKRIIQRLASSRQGTAADTGSPAAATSIPALGAETGFTYQFWFTSSASPATAGLFVGPGERDEWIKVLATIRGHRTAMLEYDGCADLLFSEFSPPVTLFLIGGGVTPNDLSRKLSQLRASSMIVMPRSHSALLNEFPEIGVLVRRNFVPAFQGGWFTVYTHREN